MTTSQFRAVIVGVMVILVIVLFGVVTFLALRPTRQQTAGTQIAPPSDDLSLLGATASSMTFASHPIGDAISGRPWITHLKIVDLDRDGLPDVVMCDAQSNTVRWIRQSPRGAYTELQVGDRIPAPAHVEPCDVDRDGDLDLLVASMGVIFPNNDPLGSVIVMENSGSGSWRQRVVIEHVARVTDVRAADFDDDGDFDLVAGQFGYDQGVIRWLENEGDWHFVSHPLLHLSGTIHTPVADFDADGRFDIVALVSQEWEEIHFFRNRGGGDLRPAVLWGSTNEDYGSSGLGLGDLDSDGDPDLLYTNGDAFDYSRPGPRPWHGVQWLENQRGVFSFHRIGDLPGAYSPVCVDLDGDGDQDFVAVSGFNNWDDPAAVSMRAWLNDGQQHFRPLTLAQRPTHLMALDAADMDGDGTPELITGGFHAYPPWENMSRVLLWKRR